MYKSSPLSTLPLVIPEYIEIVLYIYIYSNNKKQPPIDRETFTTPAKIASCDVLMSTHDGYYKQVDGLAMGSPPAPHLANGWLSQFDNIIKGKARLYTRYMDDILQNIKREEIEDKLKEINNLHPALKFTIEREVDGAIPFLDMRILNTRSRLTSTWCNKPTDTGLMMNYHALDPKRYKRSVVSGVVHRIHRACSTWQNFHDSLEKAKRILERNQYPPTFYEPIIKKTLDTIIGTEHKPEEPSSESSLESKKYPLIIQYRGKCTEDYARALHRYNAPCMIIMTLQN